MKIRLVASLVLLLLALGLPIAAVATHGPPWGYRGHRAVVVEVAGTVEGKRARATGDGDDGAAHYARNVHLDDGDELRVARFSEARLRFPAADVVVGDGGRVIVSEGGVALSRGLLEVKVPGGIGTFRVDLDDNLQLIVRPGAAGGLVRVLADGRGSVQALVVDGSAELHGPGGDTLGETGRVLSVVNGHASVVDKPTSLEVTATCTAGKLQVIAPRDTQLFAAGSLSYPDVAAEIPTGNALIDVPDQQEVRLLARNVVGQTVQKVVSCGAPAPGKK